jgi:hypothetical protein
MKAKANRFHNPVRYLIPIKWLLIWFGTEVKQTSVTEALMFPETDGISKIISDTIKIVFQRRLVDRVLRLWKEMADREPFPRCDQIDLSKLGVDWANCLVIEVQKPVQNSSLVYVGGSLSFTRCPDESLAGVLLSHLPQVLSERRCLMIEGITRLRDADILYRSALYPLSEDGIAIDHVLGAANYRPLRKNENSIAPFVRTKWL